MLVIENYNYSYNIKFSTYASYWIRYSILINSRKTMYEIIKPSYIFSLNNERTRAINVLAQKLNRFPTNREIADYLEISLEKIELVDVSFMETVSLDEQLELLYDGVYITIKDIIVDDSIDLE